RPYRRRPGLVGLRPPERHLRRGLLPEPLRDTGRQGCQAPRKQAQGAGPKLRRPGAGAVAQGRGARLQERSFSEKEPRPPTAASAARVPETPRRPTGEDQRVVFDLSNKGSR